MNDHATTPVCDLHCDTVLELQGGADLRSNPQGHIDIPRLQRGGVRLQVFACFVPGGFEPGRANREANALLDVLETACQDHADAVEPADTAAAAEAAQASGKIAVVAALENGLAIAGDLRNLQHFRSRGVRYMTLTHARHLDWAASSGEEWSAERGLTAFGEEVVCEMNRLGMIVDVSHVHERTFWDVARVATRPFMASHSCAAALCPVGRNLSDEQLRAVASAGGMVGVNFFPGFLDPGYFPSLGHSLPEMFRGLEEAELKYADDPPRRLAAVRALSAATLERVGPAHATIDTIADHVVHMVRVAGEDHVGFGSDFDGVGQLPRDVPDCTAFPQILARLSARGLGERTLRKIAWENFLRVLRDNE